MKKAWLAFCATLWTALVFADGAVWQVSHGENMLYIGGTVHLLDADQYPLPSAYNEAFNQSDTLVFETDMQTLESPAYSAKLMVAMQLPQGQKAEDLLTPENWQALLSQSEKLGFPITAMQSLHPAMLCLSLSVMAMMKEGMDPKLGVDRVFTQRALEAGKAIQGLESPDEQLAFIVGLRELDANLMVEQSLRDLDQLPLMTSKMLAYWREGDLAGLRQLLVTPMLAKVPELYQNMVVNRNNNWLPSLKALLATPETEFVLVGALHLPGDEGVLNLLAEAGYSVRPFAPSATQ